MKLTIYSEIKKLDNDFFIVELFKNINEENILAITKVEQYTEKSNMYICESQIPYNAETHLIIKNHNLKKIIKLNLKKELTLNLNGFTKNHYTIYLKKQNFIKKILELNFD